MMLILNTLKRCGGTDKAMDLLNKWIIEFPRTEATVMVFWARKNEAPVPLGVKVVYLTSTDATVWQALLTMPLLLFQGLREIYSVRCDSCSPLIFTHYTTLVFFPFISRSRRMVFLQGSEWKYPSSTLLRISLRLIYKLVLRTSLTIYTTPDLRKTVEEEFGEQKKLVYFPVSVNQNFFEAAMSRKHDNKYAVFMIVRLGAVKRKDLYQEFIQEWKATNQGPLSVVADGEMAANICLDHSDAQINTLISQQQLIEKYSESTIFLCLSDSEGLCLPILEAISCGAIPVVRDFGGLSKHLASIDQYLVWPLDAPMSAVVDGVQALVDRDDLDGLRAKLMDFFYRWHKQTISSQDAAFLSLASEFDYRSGHVE